MLLVVLMTPSDISFRYIQNIYPMMLFASVIGMSIFKIVINDAKLKLNPETSYEEQKIKEFESELQEHEELIEELKKEKNTFDAEK